MKKHGDKWIKRRMRALDRLEAQLKSKTKKNNINVPFKQIEKESPLDDKDIKRIKKEIETLKSRI